MKIGIIADIHGDLRRFQAALALLRQQRVEKILCAGDLVDKGANSDEVVALCMSENIPCVQGNHDFEGITNQVWIARISRGEIQEPIAQTLQQETINYLTEMPQTLRFTWLGIRILLAHGTPSSRDIYLFPDSPAKLFKGVAEEAQADVVIVGHTHMPLTVRVKGSCIILNPGSIYFGFMEDASTCAVLTLPNCEFQVFDVDTGMSIEVERVDID
jgi:putative phosphoesterase